MNEEEIKNAFKKYFLVRLIVMISILMLETNAIFRVTLL